VAEEKNESEPTAVERWLADQQAWQKTALSYLDSMVHNDDFLVHLGNAMRGSLLAGKPYPSAPPPAASEPQSQTDDRIDEILHSLHLIQGEVRDLRMAIDALSTRKQPDSSDASAPVPAKRSVTKPRKAKAPKATGKKSDTVKGRDAD
jgi:hypothetical protein